MPAALRAELLEALSAPVGGGEQCGCRTPPLPSFTYVPSTLSKSVSSRCSIREAAELNRVVTPKQFLYVCMFDFLN